MPPTSVVVELCGAIPPWHSVLSSVCKGMGLPKGLGLGLGKIHRAPLILTRSASCPSVSSSENSECQD